MPGLGSGLVAVQGLDFGPQRRSVMSSPNSAPNLLLQGRAGGRPSASLDMVRAEWRRLYRCEPPRMSRDLLLRGIAYRRQELEHGGLGKTTRRKLKTTGEDVSDHGPGKSRSWRCFEAGRPAGARMAWPHAYRHGDGGRLRICRNELRVPHENRQEDHRCTLVGSPLLRSRASRQRS